MNEFCVCPEAGFCTRHQMKKDVTKHKLCQGVANTPDGGKKYWNAWEQGKSGATAPEDPKIDPPGFPDGEWLPDQIVKTVSRRTKSVSVVTPKISNIGDYLKQIIERDPVAGGAIPCGECKAHILKLNSMTIAEIEESRTETISQITERAKAKAPKFWQRIAIRIDSALNIGETERRIDKWLTEAIEMEEAYNRKIEDKKKNKT